jgi:hypothetical protein
MRQKRPLILSLSASNEDPLWKEVPNIPVGEVALLDGAGIETMPCLNGLNRGLNRGRGSEETDAQSNEGNR